MLAAYEQLESKYQHREGGSPLYYPVDRDSVLFMIGGIVVRMESLAMGHVSYQ